MQVTVRLDLEDMAIIETVKEADRQMRAAAQLGGEVTTSDVLRAGLRSLRKYVLSPEPGDGRPKSRRKKGK